MRRAVLIIAAGGWAALAQGQAEPLSGPAADERVESFLAEHGLDDVLAAVHRKKLADGTNDEKKEAAEALGKIYGKQLAVVNDPAKRQLLEERCKDLLKLMPDVDGFELRITLAKTTYLKAEEIAERDRLRLAEPAEKAEAVRILEQVGPAFKDIAQRVHRKHQSVDAAADQAAEEKAEGLREQAMELRRLRSLAHYYAGWSDLYLATLTGKPVSAQTALEQFGWLLNAIENKAPTFDRLPLKNLKYEHVARSAMGVAMALAIKGSTLEATRWLDAVQAAEGVPPAVADQIFVRRLGVFAAGGQWGALEAALRDRKARSKDQRNFLSPGEARLVVVQAMEHLAKNPAPEGASDPARGAATIAMAELVGRGDLAQVLDLAKRYGASILGDAGFIPAYVKAVQAYEKVREEHKAAGGGDDPAKDAAIVRAYGEAAGRFARAAAETDAESFGPAKVRAVLLEGLCRFYAGEFAVAADRFEAVTKADAPDELRRDALWYAVLSLERAVQAGAASLTERRDKASILYITTYPATENAARLLVRRSGSGLLTEEKAVDILLAVPESSPVYGLSQRQAARLLYQKYRRSQGRERDAAALVFAGIAERVLAAESARSLADVSSAAGKEAAATAVLYARQLADALLSMTAPDPTRAEQALAALEKVALLHQVDMKPFEAELGYRRLQVAIARGDEAEAKRWIEKLGGENGEYPRAAQRLVYRRALDAWQATNRPAAAKQVVEHGRKVLAQFERDGTKLPDAGVAGVHEAVASAAAAVATAENDAAMRTLALSLDRAMLDAKIKTEAVLRRYARLSEAAGDEASAMSAWRDLSAALEPGGAAWCEARYEAIRLDAKANPAGAREALTQHHALYPSWGPEPWGGKLSDLARQLGVTPAAGGTP